MTPKRLAITLITLLICLELFFAANLFQEIILGQTPFLDNHHDFLAFYSAGYLTSHGQVDKIYDPKTVAQIQYSILHQSVGAAGFMAYVNPPAIAVLLAPLGLFPFQVARVVWFVISLGLAAIATYLLTKDLPGKWRLLSFILLLGTFPVYHSLAEGQLSFIMLIGALGSLLLAKKGKYLASGAALSVFLIKPQLAIAVLLGLLIFRQWKMAIAMIVTTLLIILLTLPFTGLPIYLTYTHYLSGVLSSHLSDATVWKGNLADMSSLNGLFAGIFGQSASTIVNVTTAIASLLLIILFLLASRRVPPGLGNPNRKIMLAAGISLILLTDLHLYAQDVVLLAVTLPLLIQRFSNPLIPITAFILLSDLVGLDLLLHIHTFPLIVTMLLTLVLLSTITTKFPIPPRIVPSRLIQLVGKNSHKETT